MDLAPRWSDKYWCLWHLGGCPNLHPDLDNCYFPKVLTSTASQRFHMLCQKSTKIDKLNVFSTPWCSGCGTNEVTAKLWYSFSFCKSRHKFQFQVCDCFFFPFQGFNRLVAIALLFMAEEDAFWCLVYIIESLMPSEYYSRDKQLIGAQVDQVCFLLLEGTLDRLATFRRMDGIMF